jgi:hypothetical protein
MTDRAESDNKIAVDPIVALKETAAKAEAVEAYYRNRCLLLAQQGNLHEQTIEAQKAEIERLTAKLGEAAHTPKADAKKAS